MKLKRLVFRRGYSGGPEISELKVEVLPGVMLKIDKIPNPRLLILAIEDAVFDHLSNEGITKCL